MGELKGKRIVQTRNWLDPNPTSIPVYDYEFAYPITVFDAVKRDMEDNSPNLTDELTAIYRLIGDKQDVIQPGVPGQLMTWSGIQGQIGSMELSKAIGSDPSLRSHSKVPTERAVGDALDTRASLAELTSHTDDHSIHLTDIERNRWNSMAPLSSLQSHVANAVMHVTNDERGRWNAKAEAADLNAHLYNTDNPHNVTAHQVGTYTRKEIDDTFSALRESFFNYLNISWDDRSNVGSLVKYNPANWNPNFILSFKDTLPDVSDSTLTYFALKPATDYAVNETPDCIIYIKRPGLAWQEVGTTVMKAGDMVIKFPDTTMYVWVQGRFSKVFSDSSSGGSDDGINGNVWRPSIDDKGVLTWVLSKETTAPPAVGIKGADGYSPIKGIDYADGKDGEGVPVGGAHGDLLVKLSDNNFDTTWKTLNDIFKDMALSGSYLPQDVVIWDNIKGKPNKYTELGPNDDGYITQKTVTNAIGAVNNQITELLAKIDGPTGIDGIKNDLYDHINDYNNPHRVTPSIIGAVSISTFTDHIQNFGNPHNVTKAQVGLANVDNTADANKPISNATQSALNLLKDKINAVTDNVAAAKYIVNVKWDNPTNNLIFTFKDGTTLSVTIPITDIFNNIHFDNNTKELVIVLPDGTENRINISALIQTYYGSVGANIQVVIENDHIVKASIIPASVGETEIMPSVHLRSDPTTTTQVVSDRSTRIATTQFVSSQVINNLISYETDRPLSANMGRMLQQTKADTADVIKIINDLEGVDVIDTLDSTNPLAALSANMGRYLDLVKAPRVHTSPSGSTFGCATISLFGHTRASEEDPLMDGTVFRGTDNGRFARGDHRHPTDITRAPLNSPELTGTPKTTTPPDDSNDDRIPNTNWVREHIIGNNNGYCRTPGNTAVKVVTLKSDFMDPVVFIRQNGSSVAITFDNTDLCVTPTHMDVQGSGAAPVLYGGLPIKPNMIFAGHTHYFVFDGANWRLLNPAAIHTLVDSDTSNRFVSSGWVRKNVPGVMWGTSADGEGTTIKTATLRSSFVANFTFTRQIGSTVVIKFANGDNSAGTTQLDVQGTGAAPIVYESRPIIPYMIDKDLDHMFTFDGTNWRLLNPSMMGTEMFGGEASGPDNQMTEYLGFTVEGHGGTTDSNGQVNRVLFTVPFKTMKPEGSTITISSDPADWAARMGDSTLVNLTSPTVLFSSRGHGVIQFTLGSSYPANSPCGLVARRPQAFLKIQSNSSAIPYVPVASVQVPATINAGTVQNLSSFNVAPVNATNQNIVWSIVNAGGTGAVINTGILTVTSSGTLTLRATIKNGATVTTDFVKDYTITVVAASIAITLQPVSSTEVTFGAITGALSINAAAATGTLSYQWYSNTSNSNVGGTAISGATSSTLTIPTNLASGDSYFFCEVRATGGATPTRSNVAKVTVKVKATGVTISPKPSSLLVFQSVQLLTTITPLNSTNKTITWSSSDNSLATVTSDGLVNTYKSGSVTITASIDGVQDTCTINLSDLIPVSDIAAIPSWVTIGQSVQLSPVVSPSNATNKNIVWSILNDNGTGATINGNTLLTTSTGTFTIRGTITNGASIGTSYVEDFNINSMLAYVPVTNISLSQTTGRAGETINLQSTVSPSNATNQNIVWSIVNAGGTGAVINTGILNVTSSGTLTLRATIANGLTRSTDYVQDFNVIILDKFVSVSDISNIPASVVVGQSITLSPAIYPSNATNQTIVWSILNDNGTGATINGNTLLTTSTGTFTIRGTITNGASIGTSYVEDFNINSMLAYVPVTNITSLATQGRAADNINLTSLVNPSNATNKNITWIIKNDGGTNSSINGNVLIAQAPGTVKVTASITNGATATTDYVQDFNVIILDKFVSVSDISNIPASVVVGQSVQLSPVLSPSNATNKNIVWSIVDNGTTKSTLTDSTLKLNDLGILIIRATIANGQNATAAYNKDFQITGLPAYVPVTNISLSQTTGRAGETINLQSTVSPSNATNQNIVWSIVNDNGTGSEISYNSYLKASVKGILTIKASIVNGLTNTTDYIKTFDMTIADSFVQVQDIPNIPIQTQINKVIQLSNVVTPSNATNQTVVWSIVDNGNTNSTITSDGKLSSISPGVIIIRATITDGMGIGVPFLKDFQINVILDYFAVSDIQLDKTEVRIGETLSLDATVTPDNATNQIVTWSIIDDGGTNTSINVDELSATKVGTVIIRGSIRNGASKTSDYTKDFSIDVTPAFIGVTDVKSSISRIFTNVLSPAVVFSVIPSNATFADNLSTDIYDEDGTGIVINNDPQTMLATKAGAPTVGALILNGIQLGMDFFKKIEIRVEDFIAVTDIVGPPKSFIVGEKKALFGTLTPSNSSFSNILWSIVKDNGTGSAITIDGLNNSFITATSPGVATIRSTVLSGIAPYGDNSSYTKDFDITVLPATATVTFDAQGGSVSETSRVLTAPPTAIGSLPSSYKSGYGFLGWFTAITGGTKVDATTIVNNDMTLYAQWVSQPTNLVITRTPNTNTIALGTAVTITGSATDPTYSAAQLTYTWSGRLAETAMTYPLGVNVVTMTVTNPAGVSSVATTSFFVYDPASASATSGGWNGGGTYGPIGFSGAGGGASDIRLGDVTLASRIIVAGGGGGGGANSNGGLGGGLIADKASATTSATQTEAGTSPNGNGAIGIGGSHNTDGGGGGGGYYGGGAGTGDNGGGGGSSYVDPRLTDTIIQAGTNAGDGQIKITDPTGAVTTFVKTNSVQTYTCTMDGNYKLECWGGKGGDNDCIGGNGGYTVGSIQLKSNTILFVYVGGMGGSNNHTIE